MRKVTLSFTLSVGIALVGCTTLTPLTPTPGTSPSLVSPAYEPGDLVVNLKIRGSRTVQDAPDVVAIYSAEDVKKLEILPMLKVGEGDYRPLGKTGGTTSEGSADQLKQVIETPDGIPQIVLKNLAPNSTYRIRVRAFDAQDRLISKDAQSVSADVTLTNLPVLPRADVPLHLEDKTFETTARAYVGFEGAPGEAAQVRLTLLKKVGSDPEVSVGQPLVLDASTFPRAIDLGRLGPNATYALKAEALDAQGNVLKEGRVEWGVGNDRTLAAKNLNLAMELRAGTYVGPTGTFSTATLGNPRTLVQADDGTLYLSVGGHPTLTLPQLLKILPDGSMAPLITDLEPSQMIVGMALGGDGFLYMRMSDESEVKRVDPNTGTRTTVATLPSAAFYGGMTRDDQGSLYVTSGKTIYRITPGGLAGVETWADASAVPELEDSSLGAIARDAAGNLYVTAHKNGSLVGRIFKVSPDGLSVTLLAGRGASRTIDGDALTVATFQAPEGIVVTPDGSTVYVSDQHSIRRIKDGMVTTLLGGGRIPNAAAYIDGSGTDVRFHNPKGLAWTSDGKLLVADFDNGVIRIVDRF